MGHFSRDYRDDIIKGRYGQVIQSGGRDALYEDAAHVAFTYRYASTALLQRKLSIGYCRAQLLLKALGDNGVVEMKPTTGACDLAMNWTELRRHLHALKTMRRDQIKAITCPSIPRHSDTGRFRHAA